MSDSPPTTTAPPTSGVANLGTDLKRRWQIGGIVVAVGAVVAVALATLGGGPKEEVALVSASPFLILDVPRPGTGEVPVALGFVLEMLNQREKPVRVDSVKLEGTPEPRADRVCATTGPVTLEVPVGKELAPRDELYLTLKSGTLYTLSGAGAGAAEMRPCLALSWSATLAGSSLKLVPTTQPDAQYIPLARWGTIDDLVHGERFVKANVFDLLKIGGGAFPTPAPGTAAGAGTGTGTGAPAPGIATAAATAAGATAAAATAAATAAEATAAATAAPAGTAAP